MDDSTGIHINGDYVNSYPIERTMNGNPIKLFDLSTNFGPLRPLRSRKLNWRQAINDSFKSIEEWHEHRRDAMLALIWIFFSWIFAFSFPSNFNDENAKITVIIGVSGTWQSNGAIHSNSPPPPTMKRSNELNGLLLKRSEWWNDTCEWPYDYDSPSQCAWPSKFN